MTMRSSVGRRIPVQVFAQSVNGNDIGAHFLIAHGAVFGE